MKKKLFLVVTLLMVLLTTGCFWNKKKSFLADTTWKDKNDSELVFTNNDFSWYELSTNHDDNYFKGTYKAYKGAVAVVYVGTGDLEKYGVTSEKLDKWFNNGYNADDLIILDLDTSKYLLNGKEQEIKDPHMYLLGFMNGENEMTVTNLKVNSTFTFTKK